MFDELVVIPQAASIEHLVVVHHNGVVQAAAQAQAVDTHGLDVFGEAKGAGAGDVARIRVAAQVKLHPLAGGVHRRVVEFNLETQAVAVERVKARPALVVALAGTHLHRLGHADEAARRVLELDARALQQEHKGRSRAVQDRHFFGRDVHVHVVQPQTRTGRHQVLNGSHLGVAVGHRGRHARVCHRAGRHGDVHRHRQIHPPEDDARVRRCWTQRELHPLAAVHPHADGAGEGFEGSLFQHFSILVDGCFPTGRP